MIFQSDPYFPFIKQIRKMIGDEETPAPALSMLAVGDPLLKARIQYVPATGSQTLTFSSTTVGAPSPMSIDLTQYTTLLDMVSNLSPITFGAATITLSFINNPLRNNTPQDLTPGLYPLPGAPVVVNMRHALSDEDIRDEIDGAVIEFGTQYVIDPNKATQQIINPDGNATYPYPDQPSYPYPGLAHDITYPLPPAYQNFVSWLTASHCLLYVASKFSKIPRINTDNANIDRSEVLQNLMMLAERFKMMYDNAVDESGVRITVTDLSRISLTTGTLTRTPEYQPVSFDSGIYGLRALSAFAPNLIQATTQQDAHAYSGGEVSGMLTASPII